MTVVNQREYQWRDKNDLKEPNRNSRVEEYNNQNK